MTAKPFFAIYHYSQVVRIQYMLVLATQDKNLEFCTTQHVERERDRQTDRQRNRQTDRGRKGRKEREGSKREGAKEGGRARKERERERQEEIGTNFELVCLQH